ncbi:MAG: acetate--CoA ligase family protein [Anaerolineae bacterium]|nr:acetate--CoA ligase family protein [Anaerolineae bacterium]
MLDMFFNPQAVAVIGASRTPGKLGHAVLHNVVGYGYRGTIYPVNPKANEILGLKCYPSVLAVPGPVDLAVVSIPSRHVAAALRECGEKGVQGAIVISAGFREVGSEGWQREREIVAIARQYGLRLVGPNCLGIIDTISSLNASFAAGMPRRGGIAFMSQSGALCTSILDMALADNVGFSRFVSLGNKADADEITFIKAWEHDLPSSVIMAYVEGIDRGVEFMQVARQVTREKPIIAIKSGTTDAGSRAVSLHTGTLAGSERAYEAAFRQSGVIRARSVEELFDYAIAFARQPLLANDRIAIVTNAGGPGIMATDACERAGLQLAAMETETLATLRAALPQAASVLNPVDILGDALAGRYSLALEAVIRDPNVGGVLVIVTPQIMTEIEETARAVGELSQTSEKPIFGCFMGQERIQAGIDVLNQYAVPNYRVPERAMAAMAAMVRHRRWRERPPLQIETFEVDRDRVRAVLEQVRSMGRLAIGDIEAREILEAYGFATPRTFLARDPDEAVHYAHEIGFPVALKIASPDILHKTDLGGVKLNIMTAQDVRAAFELMTYRANRYVPDADIWGCLVQEMVSGGKEIIAGMNRDPHFGPLMMFGLGGIYSEALQDVSFRIAPLDRRDAWEMITEIQAHNVLRGVRGERPSDLEAVVEALLRLAQLATDFPEIVELDINPLTVFEEGRGVIGIDMRLVLA